MKRLLSVSLSFIFFFIILLIHIGCSHRQAKHDEEAIGSVSQKVVVNFYIENSGSMAGYFNGNTQIKDVIKQYYDRIKSKQNKGDIISLNYINTQIINFPEDIKSYLIKTQRMCTESYTKLDDILSMAMSSCNDSTINIVISDYCFSSNDGSISMAASGITSLFTENMNKNKDMCVAIYKYMSDFKGKYYPGGLQCKKPLPFYIWIFGNGNIVKEITNLPIKMENCGYLLLQPKQDIIPHIKTKNARMVDGSSIVVKEWKEERDNGGSCTGRSKTYSVNIEANLSNIILPEVDLVDVNRYSITENYSISSITKQDDDKYIFRISTEKPSPGEVKISYILDELPDWVEKSNFDGTGIPKDSTTLGVKHLINGVYDAYHNVSNYYFTISLSLI